MATLAGNTIASTYALLLKIDNTGIAGDGTLRKVEDGDATDSALSLSDVSIAVDATDKIFLDGGTHSYIHESASDVVQIVAGGTVVFEGDTNSRISLSNNDSGTSNTIFGKEAAKSLDAGSNENVFIGYQVSDASMNDAIQNVGVGFQALSALVEGDNNVAIGHRALLDTEDGHSTVAIGTRAGSGIVDGDSNVFIGFECGKTTTAVTNVTLIGRRAGYANIASASAGAVGLGYEAHYSLISGAGNTALGYRTLKSNEDGSYNTAVGHQALETFEADAPNEGNNTGVGYNAGRYVSTGTGNTFIGSSAGQGVSGSELTGNDNTTIGKGAGVALIGAANSNTLVGEGAGYTTTTGVENTCIGQSCVAQDGTATNQVVIGNNLVGTKDNAVFIGNNTNHIENDFNADATWNYTSDVRQKKDIESSEIGLAFINDLKPVKYRHRSPSEFPEEWTAHDADDTSPMGGSDKYYYGFIAQDVKEAIDKHDASDYGVWSSDPDGRQRISREQFVVSLVKSVQELSAKVKALEDAQ